MIPLRTNPAGSPDLAHASGLLRRFGHNCLPFYHHGTQYQTHCVKCYAVAVVSEGSLGGLAVENHCNPASRAANLQAMREAIRGGSSQDAHLSHDTRQPG